ncbi:MAG: metallophosphoesterase family protein [Candidatus Heimdallarchaeota archaeon]
MKIGKISILVIIIVILIFKFQTANASTSELFLGKIFPNDSSINYRFKAINFITYPLFATPAIVSPGNTLKITTTLSPTTHIDKITLQNSHNTIESSFTSNYDDANQQLLVNFSLPDSARTGLYSLFVNTANENDFTWNSVKITEPFGAQISIVHVTDTQIGYEAYSTLKALTMVVNEINLIRPQPAFAVHTGDLIDGGTTGNITQRYEDALTALANLSIPIFIVNGNHEKYANLSYWNTYIGAEYQHSVTYGPLHLALTALRDLDGLSPSELEWVKNDITSHSRKTTLLGYHYDYGSQFDSIGADIHLIGHEHRSYVESYTDYVKIVTGNTYWQNDNDLGEIRLLNFVNGRLESYPILEFGENAPVDPLPPVTTSNPDTSRSSTGVETTKTSQTDLFSVILAGVILLIHRKRISP